VLTSSLSPGQWWIAAVLSGAALAVAAQSMATTRRDKLIAVSLPLAGAVSIALASAARGYEGPMPLVLYTATMIVLVVLRIVFAPYIARQLRLKRAGRPMEEVTRKQSWIFLVVFVVTLVGVAFVL
jgi:drug/metabolite transporter (DMT)-like permease